MAFIEANKDAIVDGRRLGVEPICETLQVAPSTYYAAKNRPPSARSVRDEALKTEVQRVFDANLGVYVVRKVWRQLCREGHQVPRCQVQRLMKSHGIQGAKRRGKRWRTTRPDPHAHRRPDLVQRDFSAEAPNELWVADISYLRCWEGLVFLAFILEARSSGGTRPMSFFEPAIALFFPRCFVRSSLSAAYSSSGQMSRCDRKRTAAYIKYPAPRAMGS